MLHSVCLSYESRMKRNNFVNAALAKRKEIIYFYIKIVSLWISYENLYKFVFFTHFWLFAFTNKRSERSTYINLCLHFSSLMSQMYKRYHISFTLCACEIVELQFFWSTPQFPIGKRKCLSFILHSHTIILYLQYQH